METATTVNALTNLAEERVSLSQLGWEFRQDGVIQLSLKNYKGYESDWLAKGLARQGIDAKLETLKGDAHQTLLVDGKNAVLVEEMYLEQELAKFDAKFQAKPTIENTSLIEMIENDLRNIRSKLPNQENAQPVKNASDARIFATGATNAVAHGAELGVKSLAVLGVVYIAYNTTRQARELVMSDKPIEAAKLVGENATKLAAGFAVAMPVAQATTKFIPGSVGKVASIGTALTAGYLSAKAVDKGLEITDYLSTEINKQIDAFKNEKFENFMSKNLLANGVPVEKVKSLFDTIHQLTHVQSHADIQSSR